MRKKVKPNYSAFRRLKTKNKGDYMLSQEQKRELLKLARNTVEEFVTRGIIPRYEAVDPLFKEKRGAFVTLHNKGKLRGCIGIIEGVQELFKTIIEMSIASATGDPRFGPVTAGEIKDIDIEISVLSLKKRAGSYTEIELGKHGVIVKRGSRSGVFLPQVALETGWSLEVFMENLCESKAGLPKTAYKDRDTEIYVFDADVFGERGEFL
ncbi:MAG TPA: AmmeMemoRadiSam system protein A [bacterium]|nr:AmmeMemoRadiSam system protein A [bacterium]